MSAIECVWFRRNTLTETAPDAGRSATSAACVTRRVMMRRLLFAALCALPIPGDRNGTDRPTDETGDAEAARDLPPWVVVWEYGTGHTASNPRLRRLFRMRTRSPGEEPDIPPRGDPARERSECMAALMRRFGMDDLIVRVVMEDGGRASCTFSLRDGAPEPDPESVTSFLREAVGVLFPDAVAPDDLHDPTLVLHGGQRWTVTLNTKCVQ